MLLRLSVSLIFIFTFLQLAQAKETIVVYKRNYDTEYLRKHIENFARLSKEKYGDYEFVQSEDMEQGRAFVELQKGNIDLIITAPTLKREELANVVYLPLDRGLLGFRICVVNKDSTDFSSIQTANEFIQRNLTVGLGTHWPDRAIFEENGFKVVTSPVHNSLFSMLEQKRFDCLIRSVNEIDTDLIRYRDKSFRSDTKLVFIYPNADFLFVNRKNKKLYERMKTGATLAVEDNSFYEIFDKYYENTLKEHNVYQRKLVFLKNSNISPQALTAINRYGIASFVDNPIIVKNIKSPHQSNSD